MCWHCCCCYRTYDLVSVYVQLLANLWCKWTGSVSSHLYVTCGETSWCIASVKGAYVTTVIYLADVPYIIV